MSATPRSPLSYAGASSSSTTTVTGGALHPTRSTPRRSIDRTSRGLLPPAVELRCLFAMPDNYGTEHRAVPCGCRTGPMPGQLPPRLALVASEDDEAAAVAWCGCLPLRIERPEVLHLVFHDLQRREPALRVRVSLVRRGDGRGQGAARSLARGRRSLALRCEQELFGCVRRAEHSGAGLRHRERESLRRFEERKRLGAAWCERGTLL